MYHNFHRPHIFKMPCTVCYVEKGQARNGKPRRAKAVQQMRWDRLVLFFVGLTITFTMLEQATT